MQSVGHGGAGAPTQLVGEGALSDKIEQINGYLKKAAPLIDISNSHILSYPVKIFGRSESEDKTVPPYHMTVKWFGDNPPHKLEDIHSTVEQHNVEPPKGIEIVPHHFDTDRGRHHILLIKGLHPDIPKMNNLFSQGKPEKYPFVPHVTVDDHTWAKIKNENLTAKDIGLEFGNLQYKIGGNTVKTYIPKAEAGAYPEAQFKKGERGDWEKEDYKIQHIESVGKYHRFGAFKGKDMVGEASFTEYSKHLYPEGVSIDKKHRRKGLASALYSLAESHTGKKAISSKGHSEDASKLWSQPNRPFGKSEYKNPDYSQHENMHRWHPSDHPSMGQTFSLSIEQDADPFHGPHHKLIVKNPEGEEENKKLPEEISKIHSLSDVGHHVTKAAQHLWNEYGIKSNLHESVTQHLDPVKKSESRPKYKRLAPIKKDLTQYHSEQIKEIGNKLKTLTSKLGKITF